MSIEWEEASFKTNVLIKNIIGKELINDDNVAVMELVKNSYDAGASRVDVIFKNLFNDDESNIINIEDITSKTSQIIIQDDGVGMSKSDVISKWLNIAYSSKKTEFTQNNRYQAGNKGVGRFSCDRLGEFLNLYTKQKNSKVIHLQISWKEFELIDQINTQIQDVKVKLREIDENQFNEETGFNNFENGTILQIIKLNSIWADFDSSSLSLIPTTTKLKKLKNSLERLINPNQSYDNNSFKIYLNVKEIDEDKDLPYHEKISGKIENQIFDKLDFRTTYIESFITEDGSKIVTELKDKNKTIFKLIEKNTEYPLLKNIKVTLYYLNPYAKVYFKKQTGIRSVEFGSIFLFLNGFRISPYGDVDNDWLGLEQRKTQGVRRNLSGRDLLGRIEIEDLENQYRVISSREGIVHNNSYKQLVSDFNKSKNSKYNGFYYKVHRRLEKYVVDGLDWDSSEIEESEIEKLSDRGELNESSERYLKDEKSKLNTSSDVIYSILGIRSKDVLDLYINEELIESLIEEDKEKTNEKLQKFLKNYSSLSSTALDEKTKKAISKLTKSIEDEDLAKKFKQVLVSKKEIEEELEEEKKSKNELYKLFRNKVKKDRQKAKNKEKKLEEELKKVEQEKKKKEEQVLFLQSIQPIEKSELIKLQHHIGLYAETIEDTILDFKMTLDESDNISKEEIIAYLTDISLEAQKILAINKYATKANFLSKSQSINADIIQFISEYIENIYKLNTNKDLVVNVTTNSLSHTCKFEPLIITIIIDNLLNNSKKANAKNVNIIFMNDDNLIIEYIDDGNGLHESIINPSDIFEIGITTTSGSGLGLHHIKESLQRMKRSTIEVEKINKGIKFIIRLKV